MSARPRGHATWADQVFNPWLSGSGAVGGMLAAQQGGADRGDAIEAKGWDEQARAHSLYFNERRPRVFAGPWCHVLSDRDRGHERAAFWSLVRSTPNLDWMVLMSDAETALKALPGDWLDGYPNVYVGAKATGAASAATALAELRKVPAKLRFLLTTPVLGDVGDLDLDGIGWVIVNTERGAVSPAFDWVASIKLQSMCYGVPVWVECETLVGLAGCASLPLAGQEQPRMRA